MHREPDVGLDPGSPGSRPGPKAGAKPLRHPGIPLFFFFNHSFYFQASFLGLAPGLAYVSSQAVIDYSEVALKHFAPLRLC